MVNHCLAAQGQHRGPLAILHGHLIGPHGLVAVAGAHHQQVGDGAQVGQGFHRLVGGAVFSQANGIVGEHIDHTQFTQCREADGADHVAGEHQEGAAVGNQAAAVISNAIENGCHGVFAHAEVQVAVGFCPLLEAGFSLDVGEV